jgi:hypothetical protein
MHTCQRRYESGRRGWSDVVISQGLSREQIPISIRTSYGGRCIATQSPEDRAGLSFRPRYALILSQRANGEECSASWILISSFMRSSNPIRHGTCNSASSENGTIFEFREGHTGRQKSSRHLGISVPPARFPAKTEVAGDWHIGETH